MGEGSVAGSMKNGFDLELWRRSLGLEVGMGCRDSLISSLSHDVYDVAAVVVRQEGGGEGQRAGRKITR
ncbi:hypothetical protein EJB05_02568, partial [Eragrostis curvula]